MSPRRESRRQARKRALDILYEADLLRRDLPSVLSEHLLRDDPPGDYAVTLVRGIDRHHGELDALIGQHARGWSLSRMPVLDRNLLRMGLYEILHEDEVPAAVAIDEAVELAKELSTDDSGRFVNGILARVTRDRARAEVRRADREAEERAHVGDDDDRPRAGEPAGDAEEGPGAGEPPEAGDDGGHGER